MRAEEHAKRGGGVVVISLDATQAEGKYVIERVTAQPPELLFDRRWRNAVLDQAFARLRNEFASSGKSELFETNGAEIRRLASGGGEISSLDWSRDSSVECKVWNTTDWAEVFRLARDQIDVLPGGMTFSPDGRFFFSPRTRHLCAMVETESWRLVARFELPPGAGALKVRFSPTGELLALFGNAAIHLYHLPSLRRELASMGLDW